MARFYLHFVDENDNLRDGEGFEARDVAAAQRFGLRAAGQILADEVAAGRAGITFMLCLDDENGRRLANIPVSASVALLLAA